MFQFKRPALVSVPPPNEIAQMQSPVEKSDEYPAGLQAINDPTHWNNLKDWNYWKALWRALNILRAQEYCFKPINDTNNTAPYFPSMTNKIIVS